MKTPLAERLNALRTQTHTRPPGAQAVAHGSRATAGTASTAHSQHRGCLWPDPRRESLTDAAGRRQ